MAYTKTTDFAAKDALPSGNPSKIVKGTEIGNEFDAIQVADGANLKRDGTAAATANIPMGNFKFTSVGNGSARSDSINLGQVQDSAYTYIGSISGVDTITGSLTPALVAYAAGQRFEFVSAGANTGAVTININGLGAKSITKLGTTALAAGDIPSGALVQIVYDGTRFQLTNLAAQTVATLASGAINALTTVTFDPAADYLAIADGSDSGNAKKALIAGVALLTGDQTIAGVKTFSSAPVLSAGAKFGSATLANVSTSAPLFAARAFGVFDGRTTGTFAANNSGNVASVTRNSTGYYTVTLSVSLADVAFAVIASCRNTTVATYAIWKAESDTANTINIETKQEGGALVDCAYVGFAVFRT